MKFFAGLALPFLLFNVVPHTFAHPANSPSAARVKQPLPLPVEVVHEFPHPTWLENLAVRSNGKVLATLLTSPDIYQIEPFTREDPILVHHFSDHLGLLGITETTRDVFYIVAGNYSFVDSTNPIGASDVYEVDIRKGAKQAITTKIANFPKSQLLNGMTTLNAEKGLILISDPGAGLLYKLNVRTKQFVVAIDDRTMKPSSTLPFGINGIKIRNGALYFTNTAQGTFVKIPISADGSATGPAVIISKDVASDDFTFGPRGEAYLAQNGQNNLGFLGPAGGNVTILTGAPLKDKTYLAGPSACQFGRLPQDRKVLYITTTGGLFSNASTPTSGGTLSKVNLARSGYYN